MGSIFPHVRKQANGSLGKKSRGYLQSAHGSGGMEYIDDGICSNLHTSFSNSITNVEEDSSCFLEVGRTKCLNATMMPDNSIYALFCFVFVCTCGFSDSTTSLARGQFCDGPL